MTCHVTTHKIMSAGHARSCNRMQVKCNQMCPVASQVPLQIGAVCQINASPWLCASVLRVRWTYVDVEVEVFIYFRVAVSGALALTEQNRVLSLCGVAAWA